MRAFWICFGMIAGAVLFAFAMYSIIMIIIDANLPDMPVDTTTQVVIDECPKLKATIDRLTERIYALEQARREAGKE